VREKIRGEGRKGEEKEEKNLYAPIFIFFFPDYRRRERLRRERKERGEKKGKGEWRRTGDSPFISLLSFIFGK